MVNTIGLLRLDTDKKLILFIWANMVNLKK